MTTLTRYWRTDSTAGSQDGTADTAGNSGTAAYETLAAALVAEAVDLTSAGDILHLICTTPADVDTALATVDGFTTDAGDYVIVECTGDAHHQGLSREKDGTGYQMKRDGACLQIWDDYVRAIGLEVTAAGTYNPLAMQGSGGASSDIRLDQILLTCSDVTGTNTAMLLIQTPGTFTVTNVLAIGNGHRGMDLRSSTACTLNHCGAVGANYGILLDTAVTVTNTYSLDFFDDSGSEDYYQEAHANSTNNASNDGSAPNTNEVVVTTTADQFTTFTKIPSTAVLTLVDGQLNAAGTGSEALDISGATRTGTADIGPWNFAAAGTNPKGPLGLPLHGPFGGPI